MKTSELLQRLSSSLRADIGPAVGDEYPRTQAFMASVILERVGRELALGPDHAVAERHDVEALTAELASATAAAPADVRAAIASWDSEPSVAGLSTVIAALYACGDGELIAETLALIRPVLRRDIDRRMEIAR